MPQNQVPTPSLDLHKRCNQPVITHLSMHVRYIYIYIYKVSRYGYIHTILYIHNILGTLLPQAGIQSEEDQYSTTGSMYSYICLIPTLRKIIILLLMYSTLLLCPAYTTIHIIEPGNSEVHTSIQIQPILSLRGHVIQYV